MRQALEKLRKEIMEGNGRVVLPGQVEINISWMEEPSIVGGHMIGYPGGKYIVVGGMTKRLSVAAQIFAVCVATKADVDYSPAAALAAADALIEEERRQREE